MVAEVPFYGRPVDLVRVDGPALEAVELKRGWCRHLTHQLLPLQAATALVWGAVIARPRPETVQAVARHGIGVLWWSDPLNHDPASLIVLSQPDASRRVFDGSARHLSERAMAYPEGGTAGKPNLRGEGPAQAVWAAIVAAREKAPALTWKELFKLIPNHYASARSMQGAMRMLHERLRWRDERRKVLAERRERAERNRAWLRSQGETPNG